VAPTCVAAAQPEGRGRYFLRRSGLYGSAGGASRPLLREDQDMPYSSPTRPLSVLVGTLSAAGLLLALAGYSHHAPPRQGSSPVSLPPVHELGSSIIVQVMRSQRTPRGQCPAGSVSLFGSEPNVPRVAVAPGPTVPVATGSTAVPTLPAAPSARPTGVACYLPVGAGLALATVLLTGWPLLPGRASPAAEGVRAARPARTTGAPEWLVHTSRCRTATSARTIAISGQTA
jgi:hypothetical protein